jgi:hypothetical protein
MSATGNTLEILAEALARAIRPLAEALATEGDAKAFFAEIGFELPNVPPAIAALSDTASNVVDSLLILASKRTERDEGTADDGAVLVASAELLLRVTDFAGDIHRLPATFTAQLPTAFVAESGIANVFEQRDRHLEDTRRPHAHDPSCACTHRPSRGDDSARGPRAPPTRIPAPPDPVGSDLQSAQRADECLPRRLWLGQPDA